MKTLKSFGFALNGLKTVWKEERNFRIEVFILVVVIFILFYFHFSLAEWLFCVLAITLVLTSEIINTAIEDLCNKVEPNQDATIGKIKDTSSAFVLISSLGAMVLGVLVFYHHFVI